MAHRCRPPTPKWPTDSAHRSCGPLPILLPIEPSAHCQHTLSARHGLPFNDPLSLYRPTVAHCMQLPRSALSFRAASTCEVRRRLNRQLESSTRIEQLESRHTAVLMVINRRPTEAHRHPAYHGARLNSLTPLNSRRPLRCQWLNNGRIQIEE